MIKFKEYFLAEGKRFKNDKFYHLMNVPMFSIYIESHLMEDKKFSSSIINNKNEIQRLFLEAKHKINAIGFPSQHINVLISDMKGFDNKYAHYRPQNRNITFYYNIFLKDLNDSLIDIIVHEWAHAWMYNRGKRFREEMLKIYRAKRNKYKPKLELDKTIKFDSFSFINDIAAIMDKYQYSPYLNNIILRGKLKNLSYKTLNILPHNTTIHTTTSKEQLFTNYNNRNIKVPKDSKVSVVKFRSGKYSIDYFDNNNRYYLDVGSIKDVLSMVNETPTSLLTKFKNTLKNIDINDNLSYLKKNLEGDIQMGFIDHINKTYGKNSAYTIRVNENARDMALTVAKEMVEIFIIPEIIKDIKSLSLDEIIENLKNCYNWFWVMNSIKSSSNIYLQSYYTRVFNECDQVHNIDYNLTGDDKMLQRYAFQIAEIWHNQYGMSNEDELWATAIDGFFKLPDRDRKLIINLINRS